MSEKAFYVTKKERLIDVSIKEASILKSGEAVCWALRYPAGLQQTLSTRTLYSFYADVLIFMI